MRRAFGLLGALAACTAVSCGGGQTGAGVFSTSWEDDAGKSIESVRARIARDAIPAGADVAVGVAGHAARLVGVSLSGGGRWAFAHPIDSRPVIAGGVVVAAGGGDLFALDARSGKVIWSRPTGGLVLHGAGDDGTVTVVTLSSPIGQGSTLLAVGHDGAVLRQIERPVELGAPAVVGRVAFVPWNNQYVSAIDVTDGAEIGRVLLREKTSHAWTSAGALYFGELGIFRFDEHIKDASHGGADHLALPATSLPGHPVLLRPASEPRRPIAGAADKVRLFARPSGPGAPLALDAARFYATYFRLVLGLTGDRGHLAWVHTHQAEVLGGAVAHGALVLCDAQGRLTTLDAKAGGEVAMGGPGAAGVSLGEPVESCIVQADGFAPPSMPADPGTLLAQITRALSDRDLELEAGQSVLLRELGTMPDAGATGLLLAIATDPRTAPATLSTVQAALASRRAGPGPMLTALARHYDFLHDVLVAPPVGTLARALAAMDEHRAAPLLIGHLLDPADGDADVRDCAQALVTLATPAEVPDLLRFFALYRAAPLEPEEIPQAVMAVGEALLRVGGPAALAVVDAAAKQPSTNPAVRAKLQALLDAESVQRAPRPTPGATLSTTPSTTPSSASRE